MYQNRFVFVNSKNLLVNTYFQLIGGLLFSIFLPLAIRMMFVPEVYTSINHQITIIAASCAHIVGYLLYKRLGVFPGVAVSFNILPTFALTYGGMFVIIFLFRFEYSRFQSVGSFICSIAWYFVLTLLLRRLQQQKLAIVPGGDTSQVMSISSVVWHKLTTYDIHDENIGAVVADLRADHSIEWERFIADCALAGTPVYHVKQIIESLTGRVSIEHLSENSLGSLNPNLAYFKIKQTLDWLAAFLLLIIISPILLLVGIAIRIDSAGSPLFRQKRMGYRGKVITIYKFRTMKVQDDKCDDSDTEKAMTRSNDQRITRIGHILRRTRIDELPQLYNIIRGEMSWIGPRPEATALSYLYEKELPFYRYRHIVRPGITGWAQVNQGHVTSVFDAHEKLHYDFYYIKNFSPWLDIVITLRTIWTIVNGFGAK